MSCGLLGVFGEYGVHVVRLEITVNFAVDGKNGCETAASYASGCVQREFSVRGGLTCVDTQSFLEFKQNVAASLYVAGGSEAYTDGIFALCLQIELCVKGCDAVNLFQGHAESFCYLGLDFYGKISVDFLSLLNNFIKWDGNIFEFLEIRVELFDLRFCSDNFVGHITLLT